MSIWTHVNCNFRLADESVSDDDIYKVFGKQILWDDLEEYDKDEYYLPRGSEGSLNINILREKNYLDVSVFGDLRSYLNFDEIEDWFNKCCKAFNIKQAYCQTNLDWGTGKNFECFDLVPSDNVGINISFRFDGHPDRECINEILRCDYSFLKNMNVHIWENPKKNDLSSTTVNVFGDLEMGSYEDADVREWFYETVEKFFVRQAFCQINPGNDDSEVYTDIIRFSGF